MPNSLFTNTKTIRLFKFLLFLLFSAGMTDGVLLAQQTSHSQAAEKLWPTIETQLNQQKSDTAFHFMLLLVRGHCGQDFDCLYQTYEFLAEKFVATRNPQAGLYVSKEMVEVARRQKDLDAEGEAYMDLYRFHTYLSYAPLAARDVENALSLFEKTGNQKRILKLKLLKLRESHSFRSSSEIIPEIEALSKQAEALKDTNSLYDIHSDLIGLYHGANRMEETVKHIEALEAIAPAEPTPFKTYWILIYTARMRAWIAEKQKDYDKAEHYFLQALRHANVEPSPWYQADILLSLASINWEQGNPIIAKSYLEQALAKGLAYNLDDVLSRIFALECKIAEAEGRYFDALTSKKKELVHDEKYKGMTAGFNLQSFYLEMEKEKQAVELEMKDFQLQYSFIIMILVFLLAIGLFIGFYKHRKGMRELAAQNTIIQKQAEVLQNLDAAKSRFFANVSHELRTPLTLLLSPFSSLMKEKNLTEKQSKLLQLAKQSGEQLQQLINEILDLSKLESGKMELDLQPTELLPFFRRYFLQFESLAYRKQIDFSFEIGIDNGIVGNIDQEKCRQILFNLLSNAFKFTPPGGKIEANVSAENDNLYLKVADSGPGIHPDDLPHLFDRYFQTNQPDKPAEGGTGIGLTLCNEYAQLFGGKIEVQSNPGKGTVLRLMFPISFVSSAEWSENPEYISESPSESHPPLSENPAIFPAKTPMTDLTQPAPADKTKTTILVVEDNPELQDYIRLILEEKYHVLTAENGKVALDKLTANSKQPTADLILSDLMMPVMDGYQLLEKLKSEDATRHLPVIMLTARADVRDKLKALRMGVDDYLLKPFEEEELLVRIENLLKNQAGRREFIAENELGSEVSTITISETDRAWLEEFEGYTQKHLSSDILTVPGLASEFAMSESTLLRQLKRLTGLSPIRYVQDMRLNEALRLLETHKYNSIARVASKVGYGDLTNFGRSFKQRFGKSPSEFLSN